MYVEAAAEANFKRLVAGTSLSIVAVESCSVLVTSRKSVTKEDPRTQVSNLNTTAHLKEHVPVATAALTGKKHRIQLPSMHRGKLV